MEETKLVNGLDCHHDFGHVKSGDILGKDLVFDEHCHQITAGQELHQKV